MFFLLLSCLICCHTPKEAEEFFEQREKFEDNWWESDIFGVCLLVDSKEGMVVFDDGNDKEFFPYEFEPLNTYHIDDRTVKVWPNEQCYDVVLDLVQETICECTF
jgi:hypothetical protein|tara:strand:- start:5071 stop:5385 length:315 start_codon:yes stop_codon:yes gene_type:complete